VKSHGQSSARAGHKSHDSGATRHARATGHAEAGAGDVTVVRVTADEHHRAKAHIRAGGGLKAALHAEAREAAEAAAREEVRAYVRANGVPFSARLVSGAILPPGLRVRVSGSSHATESAALMRVIEAAWKSGGTARAAALLHLCFGEGTGSAPRRGVLGLMREGLAR
jgi:hypothetical protein